jgi:hypothetical protein
MIFTDYFFLGKTFEDFEEEQRSFRSYMKELESARSRICDSLYDFVTAGWHYDHRDRRCLHDMRLSSLVLKEETVQKSNISIELTLMGAFFDRQLFLTYQGVTCYSCSIPLSAMVHPPQGSHGDVLTDEVAIMKDGQMVHGIQFSRGTLFEFVFRKFEFAFREGNDAVTN